MIHLTSDHFTNNSFDKTNHFTKRFINDSQMIHFTNGSFHKWFISEIMPSSSNREVMGIGIYWNLSTYEFGQKLHPWKIRLKNPPPPISNFKNPPLYRKFRDFSNLSVIYVFTNNFCFNISVTSFFYMMTWKNYIISQQGALWLCSLHMFRYFLGHVVKIQK